MPGPITLETLSKRLSAVVSKREGVAVALTGEAGMGKSFHTDRLARGAGCRFAVVVADATGPALVRSLPKVEKIPVWAARTLERLSLGETPEAASVADAITAHLAALAPFVLRLEDVHEANAAQLEVWTLVARGVRKAKGVALLATTRGSLSEEFEVLRLEPLASLGSKHLLEGEVGAELPAQALEWIHARANGNPLFTLEYFRYLARAGFLWSDGRRWRWRDPGAEVMPTSVEALLAQSLEVYRADAVIERALQARAILPARVSAGTWASVAELEPGVLEGINDTLERDGVLRDGVWLQPLTATVLRASLSPTTLRELARRAIAALEGVDPEHAASLVETAALEAGEAVRVLELGASVSEAHRRGRRAAGFLVLAAEHSVGPERAARSMRAARALRAFDLEEALNLASLASALEPNNPEAVLLEAELLAALGRFQDANRRAMRLEGAARVRWLELLLEARYALDDDAGVLEVWDANPELRENANVTLRVRVGYALTQLGRFAEARELYQDTLTQTLEAAERAWVQSAAAIVDFEAGALEAAEQGFSQALEGFDRCELDAQMRARRARALWNRSTVRYRLGRFREAIEDIESVLVYHSETGDGRAYAEAQADLGVYLIARAEFERAEEQLLQSRAVLERVDNPRKLSLAERGLVQLYLEWQPPHGPALSLRHAQAAERAARQASSPPNLAQTLVFIAWAEAAHGRPERARALSDELAALAQTLHLDSLEATAAWTRGLALERLGQTEAALEAIRAASDRLRGFGHGPYADRLALEADRIRADATAAQPRIAGFEAFGHLGWRHVGHRYFPALALEPTAKTAPTRSTSTVTSDSNARLEVLGAPRIHVLGTMRLVVSGETLPSPAEQGKAFLALLLEARVTGREGVRALELIDVLYPDTDEAHGLGALKQLVYRVRSGLGKGAVLRVSDGYALGAVITDAEQFLETSNPNLWRGPVLSDLPEDTAPALRDALSEALRVALPGMMDTDPTEAARLAAMLREPDPYDLETLRLELQALERTGESRRLERVYAAAREVLEEVGERLPEDWQVFMSKSW